MFSDLNSLLDEYYVARHSKDRVRLTEAVAAIRAFEDSAEDRPFVVRQFEGTPWVPLHEAARLHDAVQEAGLTIAGLRNELALLSVRE